MPVNPALIPSFRFPNNVPEDAAHPAVRKALDSHTKAITDLQSAIPELKSQIDATTVTTITATQAPFVPNNPTVIPGNTPAVTHEWIDAYDSTSGTFTQTRPDYTDLTGLPTLPVTKAPVAGEYLTGYNSVTGAFSQSTPAGISATIVTAALTIGGTQGSMTFVGGILTAQTQAT